MKNFYEFILINESKSTDTIIHKLTIWCYKHVEEYIKELIYEKLNVKHNYKFNMSDSDDKKIVDDIQNMRYKDLFTNAEGIPHILCDFFTDDMIEELKEVEDKKIIDKVVKMINDGIMIFINPANEAHASMNVLDSGQYSLEINIDNKVLPIKISYDGSILYKDDTMKLLIAHELRHLLNEYLINDKDFDKLNKKYNDDIDKGAKYYMNNIEEISSIFHEIVTSIQFYELSDSYYDGETDENDEKSYIKRDFNDIKKEFESKIRYKNLISQDNIKRLLKRLAKYYSDIDFNENYPKNEYNRNNRNKNIKIKE